MTKQPSTSVARSAFSECAKIVAKGSNVGVSRRVSRRDMPRTSRRMAIPLGTSARVIKHRMRSKSKEVLSDNEDLTQPMRIQHGAEAAPELFAMTQTPLPIDPTAENFADLVDLSRKRTRAQSTESISMRHPPKDENTESDTSRRFSKASFAATIRSNFLRSLSRNKRRPGQSRSPSGNSVSSDIPSLRDRLSTASVISPKRRRKRRRTSELYSPWLRNSHFHFLKKYRVPTAKPRISAPLARDSVFSPGWSRLKNLSTEFGRQTKNQLIIRSSKVRSSKSAPKPPCESAGLPGSVCRFLLPSKTPRFEGSERSGFTALLICRHCGSKVTSSLKRASVATSPGPCPIVRDAAAYWPEMWQPSPREKVGPTDASPAATSVVTIQPSYIPQTFSPSSSISESKIQVTFVTYLGL